MKIFKNWHVSIDFSTKFNKFPICAAPPLEVEMHISKDFLYFCPNFRERCDKIILIVKKKRKISIKIVKHCKILEKLISKDSWKSFPRQGRAPPEPLLNGPLTSPPLLDIDPRKIPAGTTARPLKLREF